MEFVHTFSSGLIFPNLVNQELEEFAFQYMLHHLTSVVQSESFAELDGELVKCLMGILAESGAFKY
jgi:hypothetical protein